MDHGLRRRHLLERLGELGLESFLVTSLPNVRYLTGFTGSSGALLAAPSDVRLLTDGRYLEQAHREAGGHGEPRVDVAVSTPADGVGRLTGSGVARLGFETTLSYRDYTTLADAASGRIELVGVTGLVERLRAVKDGEEIRSLERAAELTDGGFTAVLERLQPGVSEAAVALELEIAMRRAGADDVAFEPIVAFGENASEPHHRPGPRELRHGDVVKLDFGALMGGYHADMTRTVSLGPPPEELRRVHALVASAQGAASEAIHAGMTLGTLDAAARDPIEEAGYGDGYTHPLGHGVGLEIHEWPILRRGSDEVLPAGAVVTLEPGVYLPGTGGVRIEDMVLVGTDGPRSLTRSTRELVQL